MMSQRSKKTISGLIALLLAGSLAVTVRDSASISFFVQSLNEVVVAAVGVDPTPVTDSSGS